MQSVFLFNLFLFLLTATDFHHRHCETVQRKRNRLKQPSLTIAHPFGIFSFNYYIAHENELIKHREYFEKTVQVSLDIFLLNLL